MDHYLLTHAKESLITITCELSEDKYSCEKRTGFPKNALLMLNASKYKYILQYLTSNTLMNWFEKYPSLRGVLTSNTLMNWLLSYLKYSDELVTILPQIL